ncbi:MRG-domain-containing protein [Baffinella frigidus]|nr:MRG-domain-containing protein [Cryptophyta sp. CCMP2293]
MARAEKAKGARKAPPATAAAGKGKAAPPAPKPPAASRAKAPAPPAAPPAIVKKKTVDRKDSHDSDPSWLGFVADAALLSPTVKQGALDESSTVTDAVAEAMRQIEASPSLTSPSEHSSTPRLPGFALSEILRKALILDFRTVVEGGRLHLLPAPLSVRDITLMYASCPEATGKPGERGGGFRKAGEDAAPAFLSKVPAEQREKFGAALCSYFDTFLKLRLLYSKSEERQLAREKTKWAAREEFSPSQIYGGEHLIRLLSILGELLAHAPVNEQRAGELAAVHADLGAFMTRNLGKGLLRAAPEVERMV